MEDWCAVTLFAWFEMGVFLMLVFQGINYLDQNILSILKL